MLNLSLQILLTVLVVLDFQDQNYKPVLESSKTLVK